MRDEDGTNAAALESLRNGKSAVLLAHPTFEVCVARAPGVLGVLVFCAG